MDSKERLQTTLQHSSPDKICVDFGATAITGIHINIIDKLRHHYGLEYQPVKVIEPYQMLGEIDEQLQEIIGVDVVDIKGANCLFGFPLEGWKEFQTPWGQCCLVPEKFTTDEYDNQGDLLIYPQGNKSVPPSAKMPKSGYFYDAIIRQQPIDDDNLNVEDNLEEFGYISDEHLAIIASQYNKLITTNKGIVASFGGTGLGDVALVPGMDMLNPKGIRDIVEWYISTIQREDYIREVFDRQTDIALENLKRIYEVTGNGIDVINICGTDFGTQDSQFCSKETFDSLYKPYYKKVNDWIHANTTWKTFKHSCGAILPLLPNLIDAGFDCINPVQISAKDMDPKYLKSEFGDKITFWGGGVDTQTTLMYGKPNEVSDQVKRLCDIFGQDGGYVFNAVHNIQANVPVENVVAMIEALREIRG